MFALTWPPLESKADQGASNSSKAKDFSEDLKETCNRVMLAIFQESMGI